jgi:16S rRNA (cytidine1402-2'-O)-methyltransferase
LVLFETGSRLTATLADLAAGAGDREAAVCRELTKLHEEVRRGPLARPAAEADQSETRGEFVLVIAPPPATAEIAAADLDALLRGALDRASLKDAVAEIAEVTGRPRREIYRRALALARENGDAAAD